MNPKHTVKVLFAAALGVMAILVLPGLAGAKDRNHDHIPDRWEQRHHLSLDVNQARLDQDGDHLRNRAEFEAGDNPRDRDSDDDGVIDGQENAGTIASFDATSGKLVIDLFGTDTVSGLVTAQTEIKCEGVEDHQHGRRAEELRRVRARRRPRRPWRRAGDDNGGDNSGPGRHGDEGEGAGCTQRRPGPGRGRPRGRPGDRARHRDLRRGRAGTHSLGREVYLASSQSWPTPMSTSSGGSSW